MKENATAITASYHFAFALKVNNLSSIVKILHHTLYYKYIVTIFEYSNLLSLMILSEEN